LKYSLQTELLFSDNNVNNLGIHRHSSLAESLVHRCQTPDIGHRTRQVIWYSVQCCYALQTVDRQILTLKCTMLHVASYQLQRENHVYCMKKI